MHFDLLVVIPAEAGIQKDKRSWIPIFMGMTITELEMIFSEGYYDTLTG
jgi:hypothetical protein